MITILMAVYNGEMYLKEQLESIRRQTYSKWRLIARDDGSKDNSVKILEEFASSVQNEVTVYVNQPGLCKWLCASLGYSMMKKKRVLQNCRIL